MKHYLKFSRVRAAQRGQSTVEFVVYLPILLTLILIVLMAGFMINAQLRLQNLDYSFCMYSVRYRALLTSGSEGALDAVTNGMAGWGGDAFGTVFPLRSPMEGFGATPTDCTTYVVQDWPAFTADWLNMQASDSAPYHKITVYRSPFIHIKSFP